MKVYLWVNGGNTEGIVLHFRYIYLVVQMAVTVVGYLCLRKREKWIASIKLTLHFALDLPNGIGYSAIMIPLSFTGLAAFLLSEKRRWSLRRAVDDL